MSKVNVTRKLENLEGRLGTKEEWVHMVFWLCDPRSLFGDVHLYFVKEPYKEKVVPFTDQEEIEMLREEYAEDKAAGHVHFGAKSFSEYIEKHAYLCSEDSLPRLKATVEKVRAEEKCP